ncbi:MAG: NTP transferase domain-containing protein [Desulfomonile tiedjei]|uniref:glucose-1-phosphate thymidylyltransferase n=1 Tax=Desulfomonile tiedjei TaxID=2358 RepID=A0A9D6V1A9_9BACT|nr:NTP transferase domain-containing protein [Desulfomonile tiedjei]
MNGVVLAGGLGTRLYPLTKITNKHLLPVYNRAMITYPIECLVRAGIKNILVVTGGNNPGDFLRILGNGKLYGADRINYAYQEGEGGIADALALAEAHAAGGRICVVLGDNIIERNIAAAAEDYRKQEKGARILLKEVQDPRRFGVPVFENGALQAIEEKPKNPRSKYAVTGIYMYDNQVFDFIKTLSPSQRGELEITDVNNIYIQQGTMSWSILEGWWTDAGTFESLLNASNLVAEGGANNI